MGQMIKWKDKLIRISPTSAKKLEYSPDAGRTWYPGYLGNQYDFEFQDLMENGNEILATTTMGLFYSNDAYANSWMRK